MGNELDPIEVNDEGHRVALSSLNKTCVNTTFTLTPTFLDKVALSVNADPRAAAFVKAAHRCHKVASFAAPEMKGLAILTYVRAKASYFRGSIVHVVDCSLALGSLDALPNAQGNYNRRIYSALVNWTSADDVIKVVTISSTGDGRCTLAGFTSKGLSSKLEFEVTSSYLEALGDLAAKAVPNQELPFVLCAANRLGTQVVALPRPYRHAHILWHTRRAEPTVATEDFNQGFLTSGGQWISRGTAFDLAGSQHQIVRWIGDYAYDGDLLFTEDLW